MHILNFLIAGTALLAGNAELYYLEPTTNPIINFASSLLYSELSARWNELRIRSGTSKVNFCIPNPSLAGIIRHSELCWLEPTTNTIRKLASSLSYCTLLAETDKSDPVVQMRILHFLIAGNAELCSLEPTTNLIRNFASSLLYFELSARCNERRIWSEILKVYFYIPNSPLAGTISHSELSAG